MSALGAWVDRRALERLRALSAPWGGTLRILGLAAFEDLAEEDGYSWAPFATASSGIGVHHARRIVLLAAPMRSHRVAEVLHEMAHVFASRVEPDEAEEYDFLGWEMAVARLTGLPWSAWREKNDYQMWADGSQKDYRWAAEVHACTDAQMEALFADRLARARELGQVDAEARPLCVRGAVAKRKGTT